MLLLLFIGKCRRALRDQNHYMGQNNMSLKMHGVPVALHFIAHGHGYQY